MRKVCKLGREVLDITAAAVKPGVTTDYLDEICHKACLEREVSGIIVSVMLFEQFANLWTAGLPFSTQLQPLPQIFVYIA